MQVLLAGYNLDKDHTDLVRDVIDEYSQSDSDSMRLAEVLQKLAEDPLTPETLSAAYARISRSEKSIRELRRDARASVSRARRSNEQIVFGLGHASVAEHAVFNLDITGISRLALEELEAHRLASYTEASQRYIALSGDFIVPDEIRSIGRNLQFSDVCNNLFSSYCDLIEILEKFHSDLPERERAGRAREDARYVLPLACRSQVGVTINARGAEGMIRSFNRSPLSEVRLMGRQIHEELKPVAPSLIRYTESKPSFTKAEREMTTSAHECLQSEPEKPEKDVVLIEFPPNGDKLALAALLFRSGQCSYSKAMATAEKMNRNEVIKFLITAHRYIDEHEPIRREMELGYFIFSITLSASAFAQLKRHRIASLIKQDYNPELGVTIPPAIKEAGGEKTFQKAIEQANSEYKELINKLQPEVSTAVQYALTNAHRRRIVFQANARELTHLSRLREDSHAQWDIRRIANLMIQKAREACPSLMLFACGKDQFQQYYNDLLKKT